MRVHNYVVGACAIMAAMIAAEEVVASYIVPSTSPPFIRQYEVRSGIPNGVGQSVGGNLVPLPAPFVLQAPSFSDSQFSGSAMAAYVLNINPHFASITGWTSGTVSFYDFGLAHTSTFAVVNFQELYFDVLPEPGEHLGDPVTVYAHYATTVAGNPGAWTALAGVNRNVTLAASFSGHGPPSTVAINGVIGDRFSISIALSSGATALNPAIGFGPNAMDGVIAIDFSPLDIPPPPATFTPPNPVPEPSCLANASIGGIWIWLLHKRARRLKKMK